MIAIKTYTKSYSYTRTRIGIIDDHFEMFLKCSDISKHDSKLLLEAVERKELSAVGIYIEDGGYRLAEVEFEIDWDEHERMIGIEGVYFDAGQPGWEEGISPEAYVSAQRLVKAAREMNKPVWSWIRVSPEVRSDADRHKAVCDKLGYSYGSTVPEWKNPPREVGRRVNGLQEAKVIRRSS